VAKVPLFAKCGDLFVEAICQKLKYSLLLKDYYCVTAGDKGREMFFLGKGSVQVVSPDGSAVYATLNSGSFFGEIALVEETRRTASIRAADLCELFVLYKEDFDTVVKRFPAAVLIMKEEVEERKRQLAAKKEAEQKKLQSAATKLKFITQLKPATPEKEEEKPNSARFKLDISKLRRGSNATEVGSARSTTPRSGNLLTRLMTRRGTDASVVEAPTFSASSSFASQRSDQSPRDESPINSARSVVTARSNKVEPEPKPE
jgi:CRP-like cAMP-binding protein